MRSEEKDRVSGEKRLALLEQLYCEGYRYITATKKGDLLYSDTVGVKIEEGIIGFWTMHKPESFLLNKLDRSLFPDITWENDKPFMIAEALGIE